MQDEKGRQWQETVVQDRKGDGRGEKRVDNNGRWWHKRWQHKMVAGDGGVRDSSARWQYMTVGGDYRGRQLERPYLEMMT